MLLFMRLLATLALIAAFLFTVPGFAHALDAPHSHGQSMDDSVSGEAPEDKKAPDCHHGCSHGHATDRARVARFSDPVVWVGLQYSPEPPAPPATVITSPPYKPPRA